MTNTPSPYNEQEIQRQRLLWLTSIRWSGAAMILFLGIIGLFTQSYFLQGEVLCGIAAFMFGYNYYFYRQIQSPFFPPHTALYQVLLDIFVLTISLFFTGGFLNPFFTFYFFQVIIVWMVLSYKQSVSVTILITMCFAMQGLSSFHDVKVFGQPFHVVGAPISFILTTVVTAYFVYIIMQDLRKREEDVIHARQQSMQAQRLAAIGQLAAGVAHEINTPLGTISLVASDAIETLSEANPPNKDEIADARESLLTIQEQTKRCKTITKTLLEFSRKPEVVLEVCTINDITETALELCLHKASHVRIEPCFGNIQSNITVDRSGVERAVCNLLLNAIDAVEYKKDQAHVTVLTQESDQAQIITIKDNGCGISTENLSRLYEPFFTTKDVGKGTGLGLYITYGIIQDTGGTLDIQSELEKGTQAVITIPKSGETL